MEYKTVILSVFIMSLVLAQIQVEATTVCCPDWPARDLYVLCSNTWLEYSKEECVRKCRCISVSGTCPPEYPNDIIKSSGDAINEYCNLGCATSVCGALTTLQNSDASETVNQAVKKCTKTCSTLCAKGSTIAVETA